MTRIPHPAVDRLFRRALAALMAVAWGAAMAQAPAPPQAPTPPPAQAQDYKIGVINTDRILRESAPAREAAQKIEAEFKQREANVARLDRELRDVAAKLERDSPTMTEADRTARQRDVEARGRDLDRQRRQLAEDLKARQFDEMNRIKERLDTVLTKLAREQGYDLILQDGLFVRPTVDITDAVIKALDAK